MKAFTALILIAIVAFSIIALPTLASDMPSVGVKEGNWIEYAVNITGNPPAVHRNVTSMRIDVLKVEDTAFPVNLTVKFANGTLDSSIWKFNFTEGNVEGWIIIPADLSPGNTFYDAYSKTDKNITIQRQEQKTVLGTTRTVTYANDSYREKQWDKTTGVFIGSLETFRNWSAQVQITATNMWSPQILGPNQTALTALYAAIAVLACLSLVIAVARRKRRQKR